MSDKKIENEPINIALLFIIVPTIMLIVGYFIYPYPASTIESTLIQIPMFLGLILLGIGFFIKTIDLGNKVKIFGWSVFAFFWATQPTTLYLGEDGDIFNAAVCVIGVYFLFYIAYHEWLSIKRKESISCLNWLAGASAIAGLIYFGIERTFIASWLIDVVASQSGWILNAVIGDVEVIGNIIYWKGNYVVTIIFACTAIQAMVIFVGMIGAFIVTRPEIMMSRKIKGLLVTVVPIYFLNLLRNALVGLLLAKDIVDFNLAHNVIAKIGALITLIVLLFIVIKILPEILDELYCISDLPKRKGPLEKLIWSKK